VIDDHRTVARHSVEVGRGEAALDEERIEPPPGQDPLTIRLPLGERREPLNDTVDARDAVPDDPVRRPPVIGAEIGVVPNPAFEDVRMAFHEAGHEHLVSKAHIEFGRAPARERLPRPDAEDASVPHGDVRRRRAIRVHGQDAARGEDARARRHLDTPSGQSARRVGSRPLGRVATVRLRLSARLAFEASVNPRAVPP
jgi:hypothetical protein